MGIVVVIPAYNAGRYLPVVVARITGAPLPALQRIIVVNDGSTDDTRAVVAALPAQRCPIELIDRPANGGYGAAMKDGLERARQGDPEIVACVHADGQYSPEALPALVATMREQRLDLLQGSRIASGTARSGGMPIYKIFANAVLNRLENATLGLSMTDYHSGYLVYGRRVLADVPFRRLSDSFDFDLEMIAAARARRLAVAEAPVPTHYGDEVSHLNPITYGLRVLRVMWNYRRGRYDPN
ncbi:MAG TPA: glycosyltransferase family 2 protein [Polyangia bacterium]|jgi:glycosyltransferase involved in cell wall biosynthesis|nr:glycosyltransferase family 2 protein [Polyangia bacterium]